MAAPKVTHPTDAYRLCKQASQHRDHRVRFRHFPELQLATCVVATSADSSFANIDGPQLGARVKSQCGFTVGLTATGMAQGEDAPWHNLEWHSGSIKRVVRSTSAAEANGLL